MASPLFPEFESGRVWSWYERDLVRGTYRGFQNANPEGTRIDIYGYGLPEPGADPRTAGILRYGQMEIDDYDNDEFEIDSGDVFVQKGDSGSAVLFPSMGRPVASEDYRILGVAAHGCDNLICNAAQAADAFSIQRWFDRTIDWTYGPRVPASHAAAVAVSF